MKNGNQLLNRIRYRGSRAATMTHTAAKQICAEHVWNTAGRIMPAGMFLIFGDSPCSARTITWQTGHSSPVHSCSASWISANTEMQKKPAMISTAVSACRMRLLLFLYICSLSAAVAAYAEENRMVLLEQEIMILQNMFPQVFDFIAVQMDQPAAFRAFAVPAGFCSGMAGIFVANRCVFIDVMPDQDSFFA